jgi:glycosyltransferase involved in cell wall biosynthesis
MKALLFVYVWPEPLSSAAGVRTVELCRHLQKLGYEVTLLSPCRENAASAALNQAGLRTLPCPANDSSVEAGLSGLPAALVLYDRFVMEEQFGWRARMLWPQALHLVDTQDLHTVRRARERLVAEGKNLRQVQELEGAPTGPDLERELASLYRADACLVVSSWEKEWLERQGYPEDRVFCLPFGAEPEKNTPSFAERDGFAFLGNFRHPPNLDGLFWLVEKLWPALRQRIPTAELHLYGAYPPASVSALHGKNGIFAHGPVERHRAFLQKHRVLLAPLRYGAGIKGKVLEAWAAGLAVAGTPVALEGLGLPGTEDLVEAAVRLHENETDWEEARRRGRAALETFAPERLRDELGKILSLGSERREAWRQDPVGRMLRHHQQNASKYFSLWIEAKNKSR